MVGGKVEEADGKDTDLLRKGNLRELQNTCLRKGLMWHLMMLP